MNVLVDEVKAELKDAGLEKCPSCGSKVLYGVWTNIYCIDLSAGTSEVASKDGCLLDVYCDCGFSLEGYEAPK